MLCLILGLFAACAGDSLYDGGTGEGGVGTIVTNPTPPKTLTHIFPNFIEHWNEESLIVYTQDADSDVATSMATSDGKSSSVMTASNTQNHVSSFKRFWQEIIVNTGFDALVEGMDETYRMGEEVAGELTAAGLMPADVMQSVNVDTQWIWIREDLSRVDFVSEAGTAYLRFYFVTDVVMATYLVRMDENGEPVRGMLVFTSPQLLRTTIDDMTIPPTFLAEIVFDYTGEKDITIVRVNRRYGPNENDFVSFDIRSQCGTTDDAEGECVASFVQSQKGTDIVSARVHLGMRRTDQMICFQGSFKSMEGYVEFTDPVLIDPAADSMSPAKELAVCTLQETPWTDHVFTREDLPNPDGSSAKSYIQDGKTLDGWRTVTLETIDNIIDPE